MKVRDILERKAKDTLVKAGSELLRKNPEENADKLFELIKKTVYKDKENLEWVKFVEDKYHNNLPTNQFVTDILKNADKKCIQKLFTNFFANAVWYGIPKRGRYFEETGIKTPFTLLISPSMRCNLGCTGCYAASYSKEDDIPYEEVDRIIKEAKELGIYYFTILGGEPFFTEYMLDIYEKHNECMFIAFTNGTLFDEVLADKVKALGNVIPMFSLEGFEEDTDKRRGKGVFKKVMDAMDLLRERGVLFGVSSATSRENVDIVASDEFIDMLIEKGAKMGWYFMYMPVGKDPDVNLMLTAEQRLKLGERVRQMRNDKPYFMIDFFNDAPYVGGCIAGKFYCHINSHEDVEPCIFAHFAVDNLKDKKLIDVFKSDFFKELRSRQPYNENLLMPCMMIDNTNVIREVVDKTGAKPTDEGARMMIEDKDFQRKLDEIAEDFKPLAEKAWKEQFDCKGNYKMSKG